MKITLKNRRIAFFKTLALLLVFVFLLTYASVSWIKREWSPKIEQDNISIATSGALVFQFANGEDVTTAKSVNEILGVSDFALKPVSSASGKAGEFFALEYGNEVGEETFKHLDYAAEQLSSEMALGIRYGYIVLNFKLMLAASDTDNRPRYIGLSGNSMISTNNSDHDITSAIRISIFNESESKMHLIGTENAANDQTGKFGVTNAKDALKGNAFAAHGERLFETYSELPEEQKRNQQSENGIDLLQKQDIKTIKDFDCYNDEKEFDKSEALFQVTPGRSVSVSVCIWLEGEDPLCNDFITEDQINLLLQFSAMTDGSEQNA